MAQVSHGRHPHRSDSESNESVNKKTTKELFKAVDTSDTEKVNDILYKIPQEEVKSIVNTSNEHGIKLLEIAVEKECKEIVTILLEKGADANARNANTGNTPLHFAIDKSRKKIVELLLEKNKDGAFKWNIDENNRKKALELVKGKLKKNPKGDNWRSIKKELLKSSWSSTSRQSQMQLSSTATVDLNNAEPSSSMDSSDSRPSQPNTSGVQRRLDDTGTDDSGSNLQSKKQAIDSYAASGVKRALHGTIYQLQLLMLFVQRGIKYYHDFKLATEMDAAEKFDDVVFKYKEWPQAEKWTWRFLQAKHKQDHEQNKITINDLITSNDGDFSLQKYFVSFFKIKQNQEFHGAKLKDFTICTNTGIDVKLSKKLKCKIGRTLTKTDQKHYELMKKWNGFFAEDKDLEEDQILYFQGQNGKELRFNNDNQTITDIAMAIKSALKKNIEEVERKSSDFKGVLKKSKLFEGSIREELKKALERGLAVLGNTLLGKVLKAEVMLENLGEKESKGKVLSIDKAKLIQSVEKVLEIDNDTALENMKSELESKKAKSDPCKPANWSKEEKEALLNEAKEALKRIVKKGSLHAAQWLKADDEMSEASGNKLSDLKATYDNFDTKIDNDSDTYIREFLKKFRFVIHYPDVDKLNSLIGKDVRKDFELLKTDLATHSFQKDMLDWFKEKGGRFLSQKDGNGFFTSIKEKINTLMTSGLSKAYPEKLRAYGIRFKENLKELKSFLSNKNQILHVCTSFPRLSAIKVLESLKDFDKYKNHDSFIFMRLRTLLRKDTQRYVINSFIKEGSHDLLMIDCQDKDEIEGVEIGKLYTQLSATLNSNPLKKIILIARDKNSLASEFKHSSQYRDKYQKNNDQTSFIDLDPKSQDKILGKKVNFQGKDISLNQLVDDESASGIIDQASLSNLIEGEKILIGNTDAFSSVGHVRDYYVKRTFHRQRIKPGVLKEKIKDELFFITGDGEEDLISLGVEKKSIHTWVDQEDYKNGIILLVSDEHAEEVFQKLRMQQSGVNLHWLEYQDGILFWKASKGDFSVLKNYIDENYIPGEKNGKNVIKEKDFSNPKALWQKMVILANDPGVGKSTVLTSLAQDIKNEFPNSWVVRVNLNNHVVKSEADSLHNIDFEESEIEKAIDFVSKMAIPSEPYNTYIKLQRKLFKTGLEKIADDQKLKIVILFDGFDEISPNYKKNTLVLLKALKGSNVTQIWVTTRVHEKAHLEKKLETPAYILNDFTEKEQKEFLGGFWRWSLKRRIQDTYKKICKHLDESQQKNEKSQEKTIYQYVQQFKQEIETLLDSLPCSSIQDLKNKITESLQEPFNQEEQVIGQFEYVEKAIYKKDENGKYKLDFTGYAKVLLKQLKASIRDTKKAFTSVPLNLRMLAEVVFEKKFPLEENLGLLDLYVEFIEIKLNIYHQEKTDTSAGNVGAGTKDEMFSNILRGVHHELAIKLFFSRDKSLPGLDKLRTFKDLLGGDKKAEEELARVGLLSLKGNQLEFIHRSFAEYLLSEYLIMNVENGEVQKLLLERALIGKGHTLICEFFNNQLQKNPLPNITSTKAAKESIDKFLEEKLYHEVTIVHMMAVQGHTAIVMFLLDIFNGYSDIAESLLLGDYKWPTVLHIAADKGDSKTLQFLLEWTKNNVAEEIFKNLVLVTNFQDQTALHVATVKAHNKIVKCLLDFVTNNLEKEFLNDLVLATDNRETALHAAIKYVTIQHNHEIVKALLDGVKDHPEILERLVLATDRNDFTALQIAVDLHYTAIVQLLLNGVKDHPEIFKKMILKGYYFDETALYKAAESDHADTVKVLLDSAKEYHPDILEEMLLDSIKNYPVMFKYLLGELNCYAYTVLHKVAIEGHRKTLQTLLSWVKVNLHDSFKELVLAKNKIGQTALHVLVTKNDDTKLLKILFKSIKDHNEILKDLILATDKEKRTALDLADYEYNHGLVNLLRKQYYMIGSSLLDSSTNIADFSSEQLNVLGQYVKSGDYTQENKQEILEKLERIHSERSQYIELHGGCASDVTEGPGITLHTWN